MFLVNERTYLRVNKIDLSFMISIRGAANGRTLFQIERAMFATREREREREPNTKLTTIRKHVVRLETVCGACSVVYIRA